MAGLEGELFQPSPLRHKPYKEVTYTDIIATASLAIVVMCAVSLGCGHYYTFHDSHVAKK